MTQTTTELPKFTHAAFLKLCAEHEIYTGTKPARLSITQTQFDNLRADLPDGCIVFKPHPVLNGVKIEVV